MERETDPKRVVFFNLPAAGHVNPSLPLVAELTRRGFGVLYYTGDEFRRQVERQGAEFRGYGEHLTYDHARLSPNLLQIAAVLATATEDLLPFALAEVRRERPRVVISDSMCPWGRLAAKALRTPGVASLTTLALDPSLLREHTSPIQFVRTVTRGALGFVQYRRAAQRIRRTHHVDLGGLFDLFVFRDRLTIVYTSRDFQPHPERCDESVRFVGPLLRETEEPDDELMRSIDGGPLIYVSLGTLSSPKLNFFRACMDAFADGNSKLLLSVGSKTDPASLSPIPPNCVVRQTVPQLAVLRRAQLFVTHGGMNSTSEGLALGVPLLVYPQSVEQAIIARRVQELGAGRTIGDRDATPEGIHSAVSAVLVGRYREAARSMARSFEQAGGAAAAADAVEELIGPS
ncbi:MAG: macrolide family glycosyltransferase [Gaiellaceae bacterium]